MGWNLDYSAITPGPGGTVMLGEKGGAEAVARRVNERRARERELALQEGRLADDAMSETTLVPQPESIGSGVKLGSSGHEMVPGGEEMAKTVTEGGAGEVGGEKKSGFRARWREFRERNLP
ncbi:hypothetical protein ABOM_001862 [Aspergillus bombycis]|uniref:Uncharacterized protein n=1 Tax=Aspergillus bombycis TaxID=109264 RepID=A0A1F8AE78_9EURO|nr:hypothetical protein ABOM_001862 [Aspergillus bombycis]OGM49739.1 hypothetical protein ABOM_001862 [Aspergillus bombycis]